MMRKHARLVLGGLLFACLVPAMARADTEDGGSGLSRVEHAYALPIGRPLFNLALGYYSMLHDSTSSIEARYMTLTPSLTFGLGMGFEASFGVPLDGLTTTEGLGDYDRRFDIRATEATAKLRYTANFFTPRVRFGALALADLPLSGSRRADGTKDPDRGYDPGLIGLLSFNFGPYDVPMRLHVNGGYWDSRNDGAIYFRDYPGSITVPGLDPDNNDVILAGLAFEAGFRGATAFVELSGEYLVDGGEYMSANEGYWRLTPGVKFKLSNTISMSAAISADVSSDDSETLFQPDDIYPETEFQLALSLGRVFGQAGYETTKRDEDARRRQEQEELAAAQAAAAAAAASTLAGNPIDAASIRAQMARDSTLSPGATMAPTPVAASAATPTMTYPPATNESRMMELENRLRFLELNIKINELEQRLRWMSPYPTYPAIPDSVLRSLRGENLKAAPTRTQAPPAAAPAMAAATDTTGPLRGRDPNEARLAAQQQEIDRLRGDLSQRNQTATPGTRQGGNANVSGDDDANTAAALAAGMVAGAAIGSSGNNDSQSPPASTAPPGGTPTGSAVAAGTGAAAAGTAASGTTNAAGPGALAFPATPGERSLLVALPGESLGPLLSNAEARAAIDRLAADLKAHPEARVIVLVHGVGTDAAAALKATEQEAGLLDDYLTLAGCGETQVQVLGVGTAEPPVDASAPSARLEVARVQ